MRLFSQAGYKLMIVTNQSGIGRGYYSQKDFDTLSFWMVDELKEREIDIEAIYYCPHTPNQNCNCRKPSIGMIEQALQQYPISLEKSWMIGDKNSDIELAHNAGIDNSIFIGSSKHSTASFSFKSVLECHRYFQENQDRI